MGVKPRIAVVSPFLDKKHGTERCVLEQVERLAREHDYEIHIYSQRLEDVRDVLVFGRTTSGSNELKRNNHIIWHRVPSIAGPHVLKYVWWFFINHVQRWKDQRFRGLRFDLVYSPGINCLDADAIIVHIVFHEFYRLVIEDLRLRHLPLRALPRAIHRRLYYQLAMALERKVYRDPDVALAAVSWLDRSGDRALFRSLRRTGHTQRSGFGFVQPGGLFEAARRSEASIAIRRARLCFALNRQRLEKKGCGHSAHGDLALPGSSLQSANRGTR